MCAIGGAHDLNDIPDGKGPIERMSVVLIRLTVASGGTTPNDI